MLSCEAMRFLPRLPITDKLINVLHSQRLPLKFNNTVGSTRKPHEEIKTILSNNLFSDRGSITKLTSNKIRMILVKAGEIFFRISHD